MPSFEELLAARKAAPPRTEKVDILLDVETAEQIAELEARIQALMNPQDERLGVDDGSADLQAQVDDLKASSADALVTLEFERLPGYLWTDITSRHPARLDVAADITYGYNFDTVVIAAAKAKLGEHSYGWRVEGGKPVTMTDEQWDDLFLLMAGHEFDNIRDAVFVVNELGPAQRLESAKKASAGAGTGSN